MESEERTPQERIKDRMALAIGSAQQEAAAAMLRYARMTTSIYRIEALFTAIAALEHAGDIEGVSISTHYDDNLDASVSFYIDPSKQDTPLLREIVGAGIAPRIEKRMSYLGTQLRARFTVARIEVEIEGYKPATCRVIEETEEVVLHDVRVDVDDATGLPRVVQLRKKFRTECDPPETDAEAGGE